MTSIDDIIKHDIVPAFRDAGFKGSVGDLRYSLNGDLIVFANVKRFTNTTCHINWSLANVASAQFFSGKLAPSSNAPITYSRIEWPDGMNLPGIKWYERDLFGFGDPPDAGALKWMAKFLAEDALPTLRGLADPDAAADFPLAKPKILGFPPSVQLFETHLHQAFVLVDVRPVATVSKLLDDAEPHLDHEFFRKLYVFLRDRLAQREARD